MIINVKWSVCMVFVMLITGSVKAQTTRDMPQDAGTDKFIEMIVGTWKLDRIVDANQRGRRSRNTGDETNNSMQIMEFKRNARYTMNSATNAVDSGSYRLNEQHGILYLESDQHTDPSEWAISIKKNVLTLAGRNGTQPDARYKYIYIRTKKGLGTQ